MYIMIETLKERVVLFNNSELSQNVETLGLLFYQNLSHCLLDHVSILRHLLCIEGLSKDLS